jgi:hypothetical protein
VRKHTPGPWSLADRGDYNDLDAESRVVFGRGKRLAVVHHPGDQESEANCNLIATAPELLAALKEIMATTEHDHLAWYAARAAIARAEGRKP